jgi:hypothetical protein
VALAMISGAGGIVSTVVMNANRLSVLEARFSTITDELHRINNNLDRLSEKR